MSWKSPISILQEYCVSNHRTLPVYTIEEVSIPGPGRFLCTVNCGGIDLTTSAHGSNKKEAKNKCAEKALNLFNLDRKESFDALRFDNNNHKVNNINMTENIETVFRPPPPSTPSPSWPQLDNVNYIGKLGEFLVALKADYPQYSHVMRYLGNQTKFVTTCQVKEYKSEGVGFNKKESKQMAAKLMLEQLERLNHANPLRFYRYQDDDEESKIGIDKAIEKFSSLYIGNTSSAGTSLRLQQMENVPPNSEIEVKKYTLEECKKILQGNEFPFIVSVLNRNPYIVTVNIKESVCTFLGSGSTREEAEFDALNQAVDMVANGCHLVE